MDSTRLLAAVLVVAVLGGSTAALAVEVGAPDGRAKVGIEPEADEGSAGVQVDGNLGAFGVDNTVEGDAGGDGEDPSGRVTNPPWFGQVGGGDRGVYYEELYGPPGATASLGTGGITAGFTEDATLSNLAWPGPGSYEHVNYVQTTRGYPNAGAPVNAGSFGGLLLPSGEGTWFQAEDGWRIVEQRYEGEASGVLRTVLSREGMTVTVRDVVHPSWDVVARRYEVQGAPPGSSLVYFANMNPQTTRTPRVPSTTEAALDNGLDFGTVFDAEHGAMLHFRPVTADPNAATGAVSGELGVVPTVRALDAAFGDGVYVAVGGDRAPSGHQAGLETVGVVGSEAEGTGLLDPYYDARDGALSGSNAAFGKTAGAVAWGGSSGTVYLTAASDAPGATELVERARALGFEGIRQAAEGDWANWAGRARLPALRDAPTRAVSLRALMLIRTAQDRATGAILANTTTQTPYRQDWLRDGAFFNYALMLAGYPEMVALHNDFYRRAQSATGHWDPILCSDGTHCSAVFPFEIDSQAFGVWALWIEYALSGRTDQDLARLGKTYDAIRRGTEVLYACWDPVTGLQCYASEDDSVTPSQGAQGASTVYLGLRSAASAARLVGDPADAQRWEDRAVEIRDAARERFCADTCQTGRGYMIWPGKVLTEGSRHPALDATLEEMAGRYPGWIAHTTPEVGGELQYPMEPLFSLATAWERTPARERLLTDSVRWLTHDLAAPGVLHYAERMYHLGAGRYLYTVGFPHIWSGAEVYISAALIHGLAGCAPRAAAVGDAPCRRRNDGSP